MSQKDALLSTAHPKIPNVSWPWPPESPRPKMHPIIVRFVFMILSPADQICFALTCKFTLGFYLQSLHLMGKIIPIPQRTYLGVKMFSRTRIDLLRQLQNARWKFCAQCCYLHPRSIWHLERFWTLSHKACSFGCHRLSIRKCYLPYAHEVDICSCLQINLHHKLHLFSLCHDRKKQPLDCKGSVKHLPNRGCKCMEISHACTFNRHPAAKVRIKVTLSIGCHNQSLLVRTRFLFDFTKSDPSQLKQFWDTRGGICLRENTGMWVRRFFREGGNYFGKNVSWKPCKWYSWSVNDQGPLEITLNRNLGKREWPSESWTRNCHYVTL